MEEKRKNILKNHQISKKINFWLGLKSSKKFCPDNWIKYITKPQELQDLIMIIFIDIDLIKIVHIYKFLNFFKRIL